MRRHITAKIDEDFTEGHRGAYVRASELKRLGWSEIRLYGDIEDLADKILSHESTHIILYHITKDLETVRTLDNLEHWDNWVITNP